MRIHVSAPGKAILHGEHAVVYGKTAVAAALSLRTNLYLDLGDANKLTLHLKNLNLQREWEVNKLNSNTSVGADGDILPITESISQITDQHKNTFQGLENESQKLALLVFLYLCTHIPKYCNARLPPCTIIIDSELCVGSGMGSSASYSVCLSAALLAACGKISPELSTEDRELINKWALQAEMIFHGCPSGIDNSICTHGGAFLFRRGTTPEHLTKMSHIKILLVNTKVPRNTKHLVANVKQLRSSHPSVVDSVMLSMDEISKECWKILSADTSNGAGKVESLQDLVRMNHHLLNCIGVGHPKLNAIYDTADSHGCAAKLTGAGGGGCAIIILPVENDDKNDVTKVLAKQLQDLDFDVWEIFLGSPGVQIKFENAS